MPRIRSIHPSACTSEKLAKATGDEERCYWRLMTHCDDEGRAEDHPRLIWAALFPLNEDIGPDDVDRWLDGLERLGLVLRYGFDERRYLCVIGWAEKQSPRHPTPSKFPEPPEGYGAPPQGDGGEREKDGGTCLGEGGRDVTVAPQPYGEDFEAWWPLYPRKVDKAPARKAFIARRRAGATLLELINAVENYAEACDGQEREYVKYAKTFLNGPWEEWVDGIPGDARPATLEELATPSPRLAVVYECTVGNPECRDGFIDVDGRAFECECRRNRAHA